MKSIHNIYIALAMASAAVAPIAAQEGSNAYSFLKIPFSSQAFALGGTNISTITDDSNIVDQNPALLGPEMEAQITLSYMHYLGTSNFAGARYAMSGGERSAWSVGFRYLNYGSMDGYDSNGTYTGSFTPQDLTIDATYSHDFTDRLRGGIAMKFIYSNYESYEAVALASDLGLNYYDPEKDMSLSLVLKNMGGQLKRFDNHYDRLPFDIQLGYTQRLGTSPFWLSITAVRLTKWKLPYYTHKEENGVEEQVLKSNFVSNLFRHIIPAIKFSPSDNFYIAAAYNFKTRTDMSTYQRNFLSGFSAGFGINVKHFGLGVAYAQPHKSGSSIMLNLSMNIWELVPKQ